MIILCWSFIWIRAKLIKKSHQLMRARLKLKLLFYHGLTAIRKIPRINFFLVSFLIKLCYFNMFIISRFWACKNRHVNFSTLSSTLLPGMSIFHILFYWVEHIAYIMVFVGVPICWKILLFFLFFFKALVTSLGAKDHNNSMV